MSAFMVRDGLSRPPVIVGSMVTELLSRLLMTLGGFMPLRI